MEPLESTDTTLTFNDALEQLAEMTATVENPLKGRFLVFRKWALGNMNYIHYYAGIPGAVWGVSVRLNYSNTENDQIPYEICRVTMDSVLGIDNDPATEEEFSAYFEKAKKAIYDFFYNGLRPIN